ncbi:hypothetical protein BV210_02015 [Halorientalis sp. IM1011]|uniref:J domain-containing protein n=1 Tax=Halorientalis sp. IM1011 TaxID=1932360 RepID=UPI00097CCF2D|nr:DnaJ domain-containing protein [Halorientalis sp. IM1011]AQL41564.1 hypothetical protein BV210_02015 [Halorientalis sp. IM1011]
MHAQPTFYDVLDVSPDASREEIRAAYREKAKETHPDVSDAPDAETQFRRVTRAKEVLTDPEERARYDRLGHRQYVDGSGWADESGGSDPTDHSSRRDADRTATQSGGSGSADARGSTTASDTGGSAAADTAGTSDDGANGSTATEDATAQAADGATDWRQTGSQPGGASAGAATADGYATRTDYKEQSFDRVRVPLTPQSIIQVGTMFAFYPVFLFASLFPAFPALVNLVVGLCTLFVIAYLLSIPEVGMVVFGGWGLLAPAVLLALPAVGIVSLVGVVALTACWVPFGLSVLTRAALRT